MEAHRSSVVVLLVGSVVALAPGLAQSQGLYRFRDVATFARVLNADHHNHFGGAWSDYNGDGLLDLYVVNCEGSGAVGAPPERTGDNTLYRNLGNGKFADVTERTGAGDPWCAMRNVFADYDADGDQDLYSHNFVQSTLYRNDNGVFHDVNAESGAGLQFPHGTGMAWGDYDNDGWVDIHAVNFPVFDQALLKNNGDGTFTNVTLASGLPEKASAMGNMWGDFDKDGDLDLASAVVTNGDSNYLYRNEGDGTFTPITAEAGIVTELGSSGSAVVWADYDNDLWLDLLLTEVSLGAEPPKGDTVPNRLYLFRNNRDGTFTDVTEEAGLLTARLGEDYWDAGFADQDSDGNLDLYVAVDKGPNLFFRGTGGGRFSEIGSRLGVDLPGSGKGLAWADYDDDGDMDLYTLNYLSETGNVPNPTYLFRNSGGNNNWLQVELKGTVSNLDAIGARIGIAPNTGRRQMREISAGRGFFAQDSSIQHFGLGLSTDTRVTVRWPSGVIDSVLAVAANQRITIVEGEGEVPR